MMHVRIDLLGGPTGEVEQWEALLKRVGQVADRLLIEHERRAYPRVPPTPCIEDDLGLCELVQVPVQGWGFKRATRSLKFFTHGLDGKIRRLGRQLRQDPGAQQPLYARFAASGPVNSRRRG